MSADQILGAIFGAGGTGTVGLLTWLLGFRRKAKTDDAETLQARYDAENRRAGQRADRAEARADKADRGRDEEAARRRLAEDNAALWHRRAVDLGWKDPTP